MSSVTGLRRQVRLQAPGTGPAGLFLSYLSHPYTLIALFFGSCVKKGPSYDSVQNIGGTVDLTGDG